MHSSNLPFQRKETYPRQPRHPAKAPVYYAHVCERSPAAQPPLHLPSKQSMPAKPKLGQNFLDDAQAVQRIASSLGDLSGRTVIEIGPAPGPSPEPLPPAQLMSWPSSLTTTSPPISAPVPTRPSHRPVAGRAQLRLRNRIHGSRRTALRNRQPALRHHLANPPQTRRSHAALDRAILMVQREVADRITASPGSRDYGLLSVTCGWSAPPKPLHPSAFILLAPPDVHSAVFRWRFARARRTRSRSVHLPSFVRKAFAQKRKTLANNLRAAGFSPAVSAAAWHRQGSTPRPRRSSPYRSLAALWHAVQIPSPVGLPE